MIRKRGRRFNFHRAFCEGKGDSIQKVMVNASFLCIAYLSSTFLNLSYFASITLLCTLMNYYYCYCYCFIIIIFTDSACLQRREVYEKDTDWRSLYLA